MKVQRGDVALAFYPFSSGAGGSRRPVLVIQGDRYNLQIRNTVVAQITTNLARAHDPAHVLIEIATPNGVQSGLLHDSLVSCLNLATLTDNRIDKVIGHLTTSLMRQVDSALKVALGLP